MIRLITYDCFLWPALEQEVNKMVWPVVTCLLYCTVVFVKSGVSVILESMFLFLFSVFSLLSCAVIIFQLHFEGQRCDINFVLVRV